MVGTTTDDIPTRISGEDHHNQIRSCLALTNTSGRIHFGATAIELSGVRSVRVASSHVRILCGLHPPLQNDFRYRQHAGEAAPIKATRGNRGLSVTEMPQRMVPGATISPRTERLKARLLRHDGYSRKDASVGRPFY
jgi:hypothetical protein